MGTTWWSDMTILFETHVQQVSETYFEQTKIFHLITWKMQSDFWTPFIN